MEHSPLPLQSYGTPRSHPDLLFEPTFPSIHLRSNQPLLFSSTPTFSWSQESSRGRCICFYCLFINLNGEKFFFSFFFYGCFPPGRNIHAAGFRLQLFQFLMDLPCRCWEVPYIMEITHISLHPAWKDEWQEKHEALGEGSSRCIKHMCSFKMS